MKYLHCRLVHLGTLARVNRQHVQRNHTFPAIVERVMKNIHTTTHSERRFLDAFHLETASQDGLMIA